MQNYNIKSNAHFTKHSHCSGTFNISYKLLVLPDNCSEKKLKKCAKFYGKIALKIDG